ncbi:unnamed protein product [Acanthoscelides obtectus]|uniref:DDE-1 domain-containing protein n=1 Tax=Acanthoscelides obtectus TaxID=200917 RepID=A0A9P0K5S6_ACAOB|nr:unnamed protein product [Acanthoscelides obtectus]CAK1669995.1 hypothetical protein AOBTE_LOCUS27343 [Acanthoscelides obtectus]
MKAELLDGTPNGFIAVCHKSGWIQMDSFLHWFRKQFLPNVKSSKDDPVVLVLGGHYSHTRNLELLEVARGNGVHIISLPPHCTHKMQSLDKAFMSPLKTYYAQVIENWLRQNSSRVVTHYQVGRLFGEAYNQAATVATATNGFRSTGTFNPIRGRKASTAALLTSSPYKDSLAYGLSKAQKTNGKGAKTLQRECVGNVARKCFENQENEAPAEKESESRTMKKRLEKTKSNQ